MMLDRSL